MAFAFICPVLHTSPYRVQQLRLCVLQAFCRVCVALNNRAMETRENSDKSRRWGLWLTTNCIGCWVVERAYRVLYTRRLNPPCWKDLAASRRHNPLFPWLLFEKRILILSASLARSVWGQRRRCRHATYCHGRLSSITYTPVFAVTPSTRHTTPIERRNKTNKTKAASGPMSRGPQAMIVRSAGLDWGTPEDAWIWEDRRLNLSRQGNDSFEALHWALIALVGVVVVVTGAMEKW